jgi:hypothetical protein
VGVRGFLAVALVALAGSAPAQVCLLLLAPITRLRLAGAARLARRQVLLQTGQIQYLAPLRLLVVAKAQMALPITRAMVAPAAAGQQ